MEVITGNVKLYEEHQPIVDALAQEAHHLREELLHFSEAFKKMNLSDPDGALLRIFARDLHAAHQEFMSRLSFLADDAVSSKVADAAQANEEKERALKKIDKLNAELDEKKKDLQKKEEETEKIASFKRKLNELLKAVETKTVWPNSGTGVLATLQQFCEWYDGDCKVIDEQLKGVDGRIKGIAGRRKDIYDEVKQIYDNAEKLSEILYGGPRQKIYNAAGNIHRHTNNLGECEHNISFKNQQLKDKNEQLNNLVKEGSELSKLLEFLQNNL